MVTVFLTVYCRKRCMDLVSLETEAEWDQVRAKMEEYKASFIWTSGHICDRDVGNRFEDIFFKLNLKYYL